MLPSRLQTVIIPQNNMLKRNIPANVKYLYTLNNNNVSRINANTDLAWGNQQDLRRIDEELRRVDDELSILKKVLPSIKARERAIAELTEHVQLLKTREHQKRR